MIERKTRYLLFLVATLSIGTSGILVRLAEAPGSVCAFWRLLLSIPIVLILQNLNSRSKKIGSPHFCSLISGIGIGGMFVLWMDSLYRLPVFTSTLIVSMYPLFAMIVEATKGEVKMRSVIGMVITIVGLVTLFGFKGTLDIWGMFEALIGSLFGSVYFLCGREAQRTTAYYTHLFWCYLSGTTIVILYLIFIKMNPLPYLFKSWIWMLLMAVIPMMGGQGVLNYLLRYERAHVVSSAGFLEPIIAGILAYFIFHEIPPTISLFPSILVIIGVVMIISSNKSI